MGLGVVNFVFAFPALFLMDHFGRRSLLLITFPFLAAFQFLIAGAGSSIAPNALVLYVIGMYLFFAFYSVGEGPVPFVSGLDPYTFD